MVEKDLHGHLCLLEVKRQRSLRLELSLVREITPILISLLVMDVPYNSVQRPKQRP